MATCRISFEGERALVSNSNGTPSQLYSELLLVTEDQNEALNMWALATTKEFKAYTGKINNNDEPTVEDVMAYHNEMSAAESGGLTPSEMFQVKDMMVANQIVSLSDLRTTLTNIFRKNGVTILDAQAAYDSGLYSTEEIKNVDIDMMSDLLDKINNTLTKGDVVVELTDNEKAPYKDSSRTTILGTYVQIGKDRIYEDLTKTINNFQDEAEFYSKVKDLPYIDFVESFYEDKDFADKVIADFKGVKRISVATISGGALTIDNVETSETLSNTLKTDMDFIQIEADVEYLIDIDDDIWDDSPNEIRNLLSRLEKTVAKEGVDIIGISKKFTNRVGTKTFLTELRDFLRNVEERNVGQKEIVEFAKKYDDFFGRKATTTVAALPLSYKGLAVVQLNSEMSNSELFDKYGLIHLGDNLYHKVTQEDNNSELYEYLYKEVVEGRKEIPTRFKTKKENQDVLNKDKVLKDISKFVNNRETGLQVVDREKLSLNQLVFDHTPIVNRSLNTFKNKIGSVLRDDIEYLKTDFIADFYEYVLEEKIKDTELYRKILSKFKFTNAGITLDGYVPSLEGVKNVEDLQDYIRIKRSTEMDYLVENDHLADDNRTFINQPQLLEEYRSSVSVDTGYAITAPNFEDFIKVSGKLYKKVLSETTAHLYAPVINQVDNVYYDIEATVIFDEKEARKILKNYDKVSNEKMTTENAKEIIEKSGVNSTIYKKLKEKAKEVIKNTKTSLGFNIIGEQGATTLDNQQEVSYRLNNLLIAKEMQDKGIEANKIKLTTGWEQMNGEWMYEVEDVFFNDNFEPEVGKEYNYLDIVKPNEFTKAYPQLKNVKIKFNNDGTNSFTEDGGIINIDAQGFTKGVSGAREQPTPPLFRSRGITSISKSSRIEEVLNHESTHFAQRQEGFYTGGSPRSIIRRGYELAGVQEEDDFSTAHLKIFNKYNDPDLTQSDKNILRAVLLEHQKFEGSLVKAYNDLAGEAVARNVERRMGLSPQEKLNSLLKDTEIDVREEDKIFLRGTDLNDKTFEKNLVEFIREKGVQVVTDPTEVQRVLKESGLDINPMISITNDLGIVEKPTIKIKDNTITVKEDINSPRIKTVGAAVEVTDRIYAKVVSKLKEIVGPLYKPSFVTKTATTITLNVPADIKERAQELKDYYEEVYQIMSDEALQEETVDNVFRKDVISELRRGATITQLKSFGYNFLQTPAGNVLGFEKNGVIYLDETQLNNTTINHELIHVWQSLLDVKASKGDKKAQQIIAKRQELFQSIVDGWKKFHEGKKGVGDVNAIIDINNNQIGNKLPLIISTNDLFTLASNFEDTNLSIIFDTEELKSLVPGIDISGTIVNFRKDDTGENHGGASVSHVGNEIKSITIYFNQSEIDKGSDYIRKAVVRRVSHEAQHLYDMSIGRNYGGNSHTIREKLPTAPQRVQGILEQIDSRSENKNYSALEGISTGVYLALAGENRARINELQENGIIDENNNFNIEVPESLQIENEEQIKRLIENLDEDTAQYYYELGSYYHSNTKLPESKLNFSILSPEAQQLKDTIGLDLSSPAYAQRADESSEEWNTRLLKEVESYVTAPEIAAKLENLQKENPSLWKQIMDYINQLTDWLKSQIGLSDYKGNIMDMSKEEYISALGISILKDDYTPSEKAQDYFTREANRLPLTLSVFSRPEFVKMQGKIINPITVLNSLNQSGIKQIEKDLIKQIIEDNYQGQKKISYDELEAIVRANIMPLERIFTSSYADYGMNNLGNGNYGEANTIILNAPIEHGVTGHFSGDFKASGRKNIKYIAKQLNDNTWVAVEEGYDSQANDNNIYQFVGTAGTKEAVDTWIENYSMVDNGIAVYSNEPYSEVEKLKEFSSMEEAKQWVNNNQSKYERPLNISGVSKNLNINKGMFGHIRVWQDGQDFYVAELQSDYFQKNNAKTLGNKVENPYRLSRRLDFLQSESIPSKTIDDIKFRVEQNNFLYRNTINSYQETINNLKEAIPNKEDLKVQETYKEILKEQQEIVRLLEKYEKLHNTFNPIEKLSPQEKQFIASQKEWEKRMVREAIKEASLSGATSLRFPTPYTLSVIEGYVSAEGESNIPYNIIGSSSRDRAVEGDTIEHAGDDYLVVSADDLNIKVINKYYAKKEVRYDDFIDLYGYEPVEGKLSLKRDDELYFYSTQENLAYIWNEGVASINFGQPTTYEATSENSFRIEDLSDVQQTVARKYEEVANTLKKERGDNFEVVTDENGYDWYETKITPEEVNKPIVAFNIVGKKAAQQKQEMIKEFSTILDNQIEIVSLYNQEEEEDIYNQIDNCGV